MKSWKRWMQLLLLGCLVALSVSCGQDIRFTPADKKINVALVVKSRNGDYWNAIRLGAEAAAKEFNADLNFLAPQDDNGADVQTPLVNFALSDGASALVLATGDNNLLKAAAESSGKAGIPLIAIDSEPDSVKVRSYVGADNRDAGRKAGKKLMELLTGSGRVAVVSYAKDVRNAVEREKGIEEELAGFPKAALVAKVYSNSDRLIAAKLTRQLIEEKGPIDGIIALDADTSVGVAEEIGKLHLSGQVKIVAFENSQEELGLLQDGVIQSTLIQYPFNMGYLGVKYAADAAHGRKIPERVDTGTKVIDSDNMFWSDNQKLLFPFVN